MLDSYRDLIDELLETPATLRALVADRAAVGLDPEVLDLIGELRDRDRIVHQRLQTFLREANPHLRALGASTERSSSVDEDLDTLLGSLDSARGELVSLLMNLTLRDWERTAAHAVEGEITLAEEVERHVEFDEDHVARIKRAVAEATP